MNKDNAHLCLPLVQALAEGKQLQWKIGPDQWVDADEPQFLEPLRYRIKPEPREFWIVVTPSGAIWAACDTEEDASTFVGLTGRRPVRVREVL